MVVQIVAMFANSAPNETMPLKNAIREVQQQARAGLGTMVSGASLVTTPDDRATKDKEGLFCAGLDDRDVLCIPEQAKEDWTRLIVCANMKDAGHRGAVAILQRLQGCFSWFRIEVHVTESVKQCIHCVESKASEKIPRPLGEGRNDAWHTIVDDAGESLGGKHYSSSSARDRGKGQRRRDWTGHRNHKDEEEVEQHKAIGGKAGGGKADNTKGDSAKCKRCVETGHKSLRCPDQICGVCGVWT